LYTKEQFAKLIDLTNIKPTATADDIVALCDDAKRHHFASVVVLPYWVPLVVGELEGTDVKTCTTVGFPHGGSTRSTKVHEARNAVTNGADELDVVINLSALKSGDIDYVRRELSDIVSAAGLSGITQDAKRTLVKVIIETPHLCKEEIILCCNLVRDSSADYIKTSTGTHQNGSQVGDVRLIRSVVGPSMGVKAAGGIRTVEYAMDLLDAGASRLGTSTGVHILQTYDPDELLKAAR
jgi:deoxyribose-phosphate aldolase